ncbi:MAG: hypothetical protein KDJ72_01980 [Methyloceanibacter sp.]|uniref:hypothetical protein n=1 Tax=Methyloceanibacter sp. TaxID=1965321 RepID=UPI001D513753|nr:hypothetical protein [Methyloceanibacter sp.]MCB1441764.1 hypothetical protein [Methyloceanibacter sp.]
MWAFAPSVVPEPLHGPAIVVCFVAVAVGLVSGVPKLIRAAKKGWAGVFWLILSGVLTLGAIGSGAMAYRTLNPARDDTELTLETLFRTDFPFAKCDPVIEFDVNMPIGEHERLLSRFCRTPTPELVFAGHATASFYIPVTHYAGQLLRHISLNLTSFWPKSAKDGSVVWGVDSTKLDEFVKNPNSKKVYMFVQPIYVYHEGELSDEIKQTAKEQFEKHTLFIEFRGPEYLALMKEKRKTANVAN